MRLLHVSDTHLHAPEAVTHHPQIDAAARLETVLAASVREGAVDAIALTGDICDDGSREGAEGVRERLAAAYPGVPVLAIPGNHDVTDTVADVFGPLPSGELDGWRLVGAASNEPGCIEGVGTHVVDALDDVDPDDPTPLLLLFHHPLRSRSTHEWFVLREAETLADRLARQRGPVACLTGHTHQVFERTEGHVHHLGGPSTYYAITHDGPDWAFAPDGTGAQIVELGARHVERIVPVRA